MKFGGTMSKHGIFTTLLHYRAKSVLLINLQRWRADTMYSVVTWYTGE